MAAPTIDRKASDDLSQDRSYVVEEFSCPLEESEVVKDYESPSHITRP